MITRAEGSEISVEVLHGARALPSLVRQWNALVDRLEEPTPFHHPEWFAAQAAELRAPDSLRVFVARSGRELCGVLPLVVERGRLGGLPVRLLRSLSDDHSQRFEPICAGREALAALFRAVFSGESWDALELRDLPWEGGADQVLVELAERSGCPVGAFASQRSPFLPLPASDEALESQMEARFRSNLRRRARRLVEHAGPLRLECFGGGGESAAQIRALLDEGWRLEASGWKGRAGTAIAGSDALRARYLAVACDASRRQELALYFLVAGERRVAFHFGIRSRGIYYLFKPGYDEKLARFGLGHLLVREVCRDLIARGVRELDFLGDAMEWKASWTAKARPHCYRYVFRPSTKGRALHAWKFAAVPRLRAIAERLDGLLHQPRAEPPEPRKEED